VTNAHPSWVAGIAATDTLYPISTTTDVLDSLLAYPGGFFIRNMDGGSDGTPSQQHRGWGGSWFVDDIGMHGRIVFGRTGEFSMENQRTFLDISGDAAPWGVWDQPVACLSAAEAATADADFYFNEADYDAIIAARGDAGIVYGNGASQNTATWSDSVWDGAFPVCFPKSIQRGWIFRRKLTGNNYGNGVVARYRYNNHTYIPPSWTGNGAGALLANPNVLGGPFGGPPTPIGLTDLSRWYASVWPSGRQRQYLQWQNSQTKVRTIIPTALPETYGGYSNDAHCWKDSNLKRVYWLSRQGPLGTYYADFSAGMAGVTFSAFTTLTRIGGYDFIPSDSAGTGYTAGHPTGKRLIYLLIGFAGNAPDLVLIDLDGNTLRRLANVPGLAWQSIEPNVGFAYDAATNRMHMIEMVGATNNIYRHTFTIPTDPLDVANYSVSRTLLTKASGATVDGNPFQVRFFGERAKLITSLGGVIVLPMSSNRPLAFRPA